MATENPVFKILVSSGNQGVLAAGSPVSSLAVGQIGVFNRTTGLSVDGTAVKDAQEIFLAVGKGNGSLQDVDMSAGQVIQVRNAKALTLKPYLQSVPKIVELSGFKAKCDSVYLLGIELRNQQSYSTFGYNGLKKTFSYKTPCCDDVYECVGCTEQGNTADLAVGLANAINKDKDGLLSASLFTNLLKFTVSAPATGTGDFILNVGGELITVSVTNGDVVATVATKAVAAINKSKGYTATSAAAVVSIYPRVTKSGNTATTSLASAGGTGVGIGTIVASADTNVADGVSFQTTNPGAGLAIRITAVNTVTPAFNGNIPLKYYNAKETDIIVSLGDSFSCNGKVSTKQELQYEDGNGINLAFEEYESGGWEGKPGPYRTSAITGLQRGSYLSNINPTSNYNVLVLEYDQFSVGGWQEFLNNLRTVIAIPCADNTTLTGLVTVFDRIFTQFPAMTDDAASIDCTNTNITTGNSYATDGYEALS